MFVNITLSGVPSIDAFVLVNGVDTRLKEIIQEVAQEKKCEIIELEVMPDHVHLLISIDPQFGVRRGVLQYART